MATHNNTDPPSRVATGANATPINQVGTSRNTGKAITDPVTQGFDRMMERFDKLESRIEILETPAIHDPCLRYNSGEEDDLEYENHREQLRLDNEIDDRNPAAGLRNRWGQGRGCRGNLYGAGGYRGRGGRTQPRNSGADFRRGGQHRNRTSWDPPPYRQGNWEDEEQFGNRNATCWDPPQRRHRYNQQNYDHPPGREDEGTSFQRL